MGPWYTQDVQTQLLLWTALLHVISIGFLVAPSQFVMGQ